MLISFAVVLAGALLFTNAVEWIGHKLKLGEGAVGSVLAAAYSSSLPESVPEAARDSIATTLALDPSKPNPPRNPGAGGLVIRSWRNIWIIHFKRLRCSNETRKPLRAAKPGNDAQVNFGLAESC